MVAVGSPHSSAPGSTCAGLPVAKTNTPTNSPNACQSRGSSRKRLRRGDSVVEANWTVRNSRENTHSDQGDDPAADREQQIRCSGGVDLRPEAADEVLPNLTRDVVGDMLGTKRGAALTPGGRISYHLSVKDLTGLTVPGSGEVTAPQITAGALSCDISGSGTITVGGTVGEQELTISGSGSYEPVDSPARLCAQTFRGAGTPW